MRTMVIVVSNLPFSFPLLTPVASEYQITTRVDLLDMCFLQCALSAIYHEVYYLRGTHKPRASRSQHSILSLAESTFGLDMI